MLHVHVARPTFWSQKCERKTVVTRSCKGISQRNTTANRHKIRTFLPTYEWPCLPPPTFISTISDASPQRAIKPPSSIEPFRGLVGTSFWKFPPGEASDMHVACSDGCHLNSVVWVSLSPSLPPVLYPSIYIYLSICLPIYLSTYYTCLGGRWAGGWVGGLPADLPTSPPTYLPLPTYLPTYFPN